jgi:hypothetical protein
MTSLDRLAIQRRGPDHLMYLSTIDRNTQDSYPNHHRSQRTMEQEAM